MTEEEKPLTREDVLWLIEGNGGKAEGLDLSWKNLSEIDLSGDYEHIRNLNGIILRGTNLQRADLSWTSLRDSDLMHAELQEADLSFSDLQGATLWWANLHKTNLTFCNLSKCRFTLCEITNETKLYDAKWGPNCTIADEEDEAFITAAEDIYRRLKQWYTQAGMYDIAGEFYFREMTVKRKTLKWQPNPLPRVWSKFLSVLCGYGEKPFRVVASAAVVVFGMAAIYSVSALSFPSALYYSASSFTALGYGLWVSAPESWVKALGAAEAFIGVFMMALFLITFIRKMTR